METYDERLMCLDVTVLEAVSEATAPLRICVNPSVASEEMIDNLKKLLVDHPGETPVLLHLGEGQVLRLPAHFSVTPETASRARSECFWAPTRSSPSTRRAVALATADGRIRAPRWHNGTCTSDDPGAG